MKDWINFYGLLIVVIILLPNIIDAWTRQEIFENKYHNKTALILEQAVRFGCMAFMAVKLPGLHTDLFPGAETVYLCLSFTLVLLYCLGWILLRRESSVRKALVLSIIPSVLFLESGILTLSIPLVVFSIIFSVCHILISYKTLCYSVKGADYG